MVAAVRTIETKYCENNPFRLYDNHDHSNCVPKMVDVRVRSVRYELIHFQNFPEFLLDKCRHLFPQQEVDRLHCTLTTLNSDKTKRKRSSVRHFLLQNDIRALHLNWAGW